MSIRSACIAIAAASFMGCSTAPEGSKSSTTYPADAVDETTLTIYSTADPATFSPQQQLSNDLFQSNARLPGYGFVRQTRHIDMTAGENSVPIVDVASGIDPTTVSFKSLTDPATAVLEQNY